MSRGKGGQGGMDGALGQHLVPCATVLRPVGIKALALTAQHVFVPRENGPKGPGEPLSVAGDMRHQRRAGEDNAGSGVGRAQEQIRILGTAHFVGETRKVVIDVGAHDHVARPVPRAVIAGDRLQKTGEQLYLRRSRRWRGIMTFLDVLCLQEYQCRAFRAFERPQAGIECVRIPVVVAVEEGEV